MSTRQKLQNKEYVPEKWEYVNCPVCGSKENKVWEKFGNNLQYTYVLCKKCKLVYLNPRPVYNDSFVYDAYEFYAENDERYQLTEGYYENNTDFEKRETDIILEYDKTRTHLLDVGCAAGKLIYRALPYYEKITGLEVSSRMADLVSEKFNIRVITDKFEKIETEEKYSCINMSHVLEHYPLPHVWLKKAAQMLDDNGALIISVPNMFSLDRLVKRVVKKIGLFKNMWEAWRTPDHLFEPTVKSMLFLFDKENFSVLKYHSYSRSKNHKNSFFGILYHEKLRLGSNLKFILKFSGNSH